MAKKSRTEPISRPCMNISVIECWKCKNDMIVPYYTDGGELPFGPVNFTDRQIDIARQEGSILKKSFSKTMETSYLAAVCPSCGSIVGDFFYHDFTNTPGDVQYFLDEKDGILERIENRKLTLRTLDKIDHTLHRKDPDLKEFSEVCDPQKLENKGKCVLVKFGNDRMYNYNCRFEVKIGDKARVDGKMSAYLGEVVEFEGKWDPHENMKEIVEILPPEFMDNALSEGSTQSKKDMQENREDESGDDSYMPGFSLEYRIIVDESNPDSPFKVWFDTFDLCNEKLRNCEIHTSATVKSHCFRVSSISYTQCEYSFGGEFNCDETYLFDRLNTEKFYRSLTQSFDLILLSEIIKQKFGGPAGLQILEAYCKEKDIKYKYTHLYQE